MQAQQLTFDSFGHTLHHTQIQSADGNFLVYDTRNDDTKIGETNKIEILDLRTNQIKNIYTCTPSNLYGPGVGAATFSPKELITLFIHGIKNSDKNKPYAMTRRTGVAIDLKQIQQPIFMDARNIYSPFTRGALRGGTHSHCWHLTENLISFTYNDYVLENAKNADKDTRVVGVMFPKKVEVFKDVAGENISGKMFSVIVTQVQNKAQPNTDEIEKAFDECWLGSQRKIAFQAHVRNSNNQVQTDIFIVDLPEDLTQAENIPLEGTLVNRCGIPKATKQYRITNTKFGISNFRHWLRSNIFGTEVFFLMEDANQITQLYQVNVLSKKITQLTFHDSSIHSPFNLDKTSKFATYFVDNCLFVLNLETGKTKVLFQSTPEIELTGIPHFSNTTKHLFFNAYVNVSEGRFIQIFKIEIPDIDTA